MRLAKLVLVLGLGGCAGVSTRGEECAELYRVCSGALDVVCHQDDRFCDSPAVTNEAMRSPLLVYCAEAYSACFDR